MEVAVEPGQKMTRDDYLALDGVEGAKFEWVNGEAYARAGGRPLHNVVAANVAAALGFRLRGRPCRAASSDQRVFVEETGAYLYPDLVVVCGVWATVPGDVQSVTNPTVLVEVLSPSTRSYDLGEKLSHYRRIPSVRDVLFVDPATRVVTSCRRDGTRWVLEDHAAGAVELESLGITLPFEEVFADLDRVPAD